jgi:HEPN domain-containing protein
VLKSDFERLVQTRIREARLLLAGGEFDGCYYLTGYAVEAALKACIAKATRRFEFPDRGRANRVFTHDLGRLLEEARLAAAMRAETVVLRGKWAIVLRWTVDVRYAAGTSHDVAAELLTAAAGRGGVIPWLKGHW